MWLFFLYQFYMEEFDSLFFTVFQYYKEKYKSKANDLALLYILILQASVLLLLGAFFMLFFREMHVDVLSVSKAWVLYVIIIIALIFRNWIYYTGKKRKILNTKQKKSNTSKSTNIFVLWLIPIACLVLSYFLMQRF